MEADVEAALTLIFDDGKELSYDAVKALVVQPAPSDVPALMPPTVDLGAYDALLAEACS
jgi:hypothetical protein